MEIKVSIVISSYNYAGYLREAIDSALTQDYEDSFEVIVVDDASQDESHIILDGYGKEIIYLKNEYNLGRPATLNKGLAVAKGEYICILDSDDALLPGAIRWYARTLDNFPSAGVVYGDLIRVNEIKRTRNRHKCLDFNRKLFELRNIIYCSAHMFRKECIKAVGGFDEKIVFCDDYDLLLKVTEKMCALHVPRLTQERTWKEDSLYSAATREGLSDKWKNYTLKKMKRRKLINNVKEIFRLSLLTRFENEIQNAKMKQALNQCDFIIREILPKKVLIVEDTPSCLAIVFKRKGIEVVRVSKEDLTGVSNLDRDFDLMVLWNVLESFPEEEIKRIIGNIIKCGSRAIVLLVETKEFYDSAYDRPTRPRHWWIENFTPRYKVIEPKAGRPVINEDNWFYNYGLDKVMFFKRQDNT